MQSLQDTRKPTARRYPPAAQHTDMEAGGIAEMSVMSEGSYAPPVHMIKLTEQRRITPYKWVHPDEER
jgi:hypothetical protein